MSIVQLLCVFMSFGGCLLFPLVSHSQEPKKFEMISVGIRGGLNLDPGGIPPGEKEDFQQYDVFAIFGFSGMLGMAERVGSPVSLVCFCWFHQSGRRHRIYLNNRPRPWRLRNGIGTVTLDLGTGAVFVSDETFGKQDFGGPVQILGHGGISYHFPGTYYPGGWRFPALFRCFVSMEQKIVELIFTFLNSVIDSESSSLFSHLYYLSLLSSTSPA